MRIKLNESVIESIKKMSDGHIGALFVLVNVLMKGEKIDPKNLHGGAMPIFFLDALEIYGKDIWEMYEICGRNILRFLALIRSAQLGIITIKQLDYGIKNKGAGLNLANIEEQVSKKLPEFGDPIGRAVEKALCGK